MTFARSLVEQLGFAPDADGSAGRAPFELVFGDGREMAWTETGGDRGERGLSAAFTSPEGLVAELRARRFDGSPSVEVSGEIRNEGSASLAGVGGVTTLRLFLALDEAWAEPRVTSWRGARVVQNFPSFFPPIDFARDTRRLIRPLAPVQLAVHAGPDGRSSSHDLPFALVAGRRGGLAVAVEWSGTWFAGLQRDHGAAEDDRPRALLEAGLWGIGLTLRPGQALPLPPVLLVPFDGGAEEGGNALRRHVRRHVTPRLDGEEVLPLTSFNSWFGLENDISDELLRPAVDAAAAVGLEHFVVDAAWFPGGFPVGTGNWDAPDPAKFPDGFESFSRYVASKGMRCGIWFEPEFAHVDSALHRRRPEWFLPTPTAPQAEYGHWMKNNRMVEGFDMRWSQYRMLDFGLSEVQEWWVDRLASVCRDWGVRWIRWDCNGMPLPRWNATDEPGWAQIRHVQGVYRVWDHLLEALPDLVIEQCAAGGNRIDLGTARRGHAFWMNDHTTNTDVVRRMQTRLNQVLPGNYANTNLCQGRHDYRDYDYLSHGCGSFGYSGRIWEAPAAELRRYAEALERFKRYRPLLLGDYSFALEDAEDPEAREVHRWCEGTQELTIELNGAGGPRTATATVDGGGG